MLTKIKTKFLIVVPKIYLKQHFFLFYLGTFNLKTLLIPILTFLLHSNPKSDLFPLFPTQCLYSPFLFVHTHQNMPFCQKTLAPNLLSFLYSNNNYFGCLQSCCCPNLFSSPFLPQPTKASLSACKNSF